MNARRAISVRPVTAVDREQWLALRQSLWPDSAEGDVDDFLPTGGSPHFARFAVFVAAAAGEGLVGFAEVSARTYAEGCETTPVGFLEGWYVAPEWRRQGIGRLLVRACEEWARAQGFSEFASDALIDNEISRRAHGALGFAEIEEIVCFAKKL